MQKDLFIEFYFVDTEKKKIFLKALGQSLQRARIGKGFTQEQLANEMGVEISQISRIERGLINTTIVTLITFADVLEIKLSDLFSSIDI